MLQFVVALLVLKSSLVRKVFDAISSFFVKILAAVGGIRGSRERGLSELELVTNRGLYANDDARVVLIALYAREKRHGDMLKILETLSAKYPHNYVFKVERAATLVKLGRAQESYRIFDQVLKDGSMAKVVDFVHYQYALTLMGQKQYKEAVDHFRSVITQPGANKELVTLSYLKAGQLLDILQQRNDAVSQYQAVLQRENVFDSHDQAKKYLKIAYRAE